MSTWPFIPLFFAVSAAAGGPASPSAPEAFWRVTLADLARYPAEAKLGEAPVISAGKVQCLKVSYRGYGGLPLRAWYCRPAGDRKRPALLINPGYGQGAVEAPVEAARRGFAALAWQGRGFDVDLSSYPAENAGYALAGIGDRRTYAYRALYANAVRSAEVLAALPGADPERLGAAGSGQGGALAMAAAALGGRVAVASVDFSSMCETYPGLAVTEADLAGLGPGAAAARRTLAYFDAVFLAGRMKAPVKVQAGAGGKCGGAGVGGVFKALRVPKRLEVLPGGTGGELRRDKMLDFIYAALGAEK